MRKYFLEKFKKFILEHGELINNFCHLTYLQLATYLLPLITIPYLVRILGPAKFGLLAFAQSFAQYFSVVIDYGFNLSATRNISLKRGDREEVSQIFSSVFLIRMILMVIGFFILNGIIFLFPKFRDNWMLYLLAYSGPIAGVLSFNYFFQAMEKMKYIAYLNLATIVFYATGIFAFIKSEDDYMYPLVISLLSSMVFGIVALTIICGKFKIRFIIPSLSEIKRELRDGWHVFISTVSITAYTNTRIFAVGLFTSSVTTGYYAIAEQLMTVIQSFPLVSLLQTLYPRLSRIYSENKSKAINIMNNFQKMTDLVFAIYLPIIFVLSPLIVRIFAGRPYSETILAFRILLVAMYFIVVNAFRVQFLLICGKADVYSKIHIVVGILGMALVVILSYLFTFIGAAASIVIIALVVLLWTKHFFKVFLFI